MDGPLRTGLIVDPCWRPFFTNWEYIALISEWLIWNDLEVSGGGLILRYYPGIRLEGRGKPRKSQDRLCPGLDLKQELPECDAEVLTRTIPKSRLRVTVTWITTFRQVFPYISGQSVTAVRRVWTDVCWLLTVRKGRYCFSWFIYRTLSAQQPIREPPVYKRYPTQLLVS
jgi:hypothetical protein